LKIYHASQALHLSIRRAYYGTFPGNGKHFFGATLKGNPGFPVAFQSV
jgi:hypothetical protein